jgi:hypothetical protein
MAAGLARSARPLPAQRSRTARDTARSPRSAGMRAARRRSRSLEFRRSRTPRLTPPGTTDRRAPTNRRPWSAATGMSPVIIRPSPFRIRSSALEIWGKTAGSDSSRSFCTGIGPARAGRSTPTPTSPPPAFMPTGMGPIVFLKGLEEYNDWLLPPRPGRISLSRVDHMDGAQGLLLRRPRGARLGPAALAARHHDAHGAGASESLRRRERHLVQAVPGLGQRKFRAEGGGHGPVVARDGSQHRRLRAATGDRLALRDQRRPVGGALTVARALVTRVLLELRDSLVLDPRLPDPEQVAVSACRR